MTNTRLFKLFDLYQKGAASDAETNELMLLLKDVPDDQLSEILLKSWDEQDLHQTFFTPGLREKMLAKIQPAEEVENKIYRIGGRGRKVMVRVAVAAAVLLVLSMTAFLLLKGDSNREVAQNPSKSPVVNDIAPGGDKAILTLADGRQIVLDSAKNGALTQQGGIKVIKLNGQLAYTPQGGTAQVLYNTIRTPKGGQYQLELADGSKVWLNAASSLRFPTTFVGKERTVELIGEGYFEVAHNAAMPFHVKVNEMDVQVLGTHFNINSYSDEPSVKTTLLEGRVQVRKNDKHVFLNPGQQAILQPEQDNIRIDYDVDVEEVVAWKNGRFQFNTTDIETVMRQVARWYDVDVVYEKAMNETISGGLPRSQNVSQLLKILEATGKVEFTIRGKQIVVKPK